MSNKSLFLSGNSRRGQILWNQTSGVKALMLRGGLMYAQHASGATGFNVVEAPDVFAAVGSVGYIGTWASVEAHDTFAGLGGIPDTGVWTDVENPDTFAAYVFTPPIGTWASTEAKDTMGNGRQPRFEVEKVENVTNTFTLNTSGPDRILCLITGTSAAGAAADQVTSITDSTGLVWTQQDFIDIGRTENNQQLHVDMWWAYAKDQIVNSTATITLAGGLSFTHHVSALAHVKGMGGNFANPFSDTNPYSYGGNYGAFTTPPLTQIAARQPVATGALSSSGSVSSPITLDPTTAQRVTLDGTHLKATSTGSGNLDSYATISTANALASGKVYIEVKYTNIAGGHYGFGIAWASDNGLPILSVINDGTNGFIVRGNGSIWAGGSQIGVIGGTPVNGDIIGFAMDFDNSVFWARNVTQGLPYNNNATGAASPQYSSAHYTAGGHPIVAGTSPPATPHGSHIAFGSILLPFACVDGTSASAEIDVNFGQTTFAALPPPGYQAGWGIPAPAVTPTRVEQHAIVLGWDISVPDDSIAEAPPGFTLHYAHLGDVSAGLRLSVYSKVIAQNILTTDNELMTHATPTKHWLMGYDTIVAGHVSPGTLESTEATDGMRAVGYGPGGAGVFGYLAATGAIDTASIVGVGPVVGQWASSEASDTFSAFISVPIRGTLSAVGAPDIFHGIGLGRGEDGTWISTEGVDKLTINGVVPIFGTFNTSETADRFRAIGAGVTPSRRRRRRNFVT